MLGSTDLDVLWNENTVKQAWNYKTAIMKQREKWMDKYIL